MTIQNSRHGILISSVVSLFEKARLHTATCTRALPEHCSELLQKVSKSAQAQRQQTSLTHAYKNSFPSTSASVPAVTMLRNSSSMYVHKNKLSLLGLLTANRRSLSEQPSYYLNSAACRRS
jgi:hypothetical protein